MLYLSPLQSQDRAESLIYFIETRLVQVTKHLDDPTFIYHPNLFTKGHRVLTQATGSCGNGGVRRQKGPSNLGRKGHNNCMGAHCISAVYLQDDHRPYTRLFCTDHRIQVTQNHISTADCYHWISPHAKRFS